MEKVIIKVLDTYFQKGGNISSCNQLVKHQIDSFNDFLDIKLEQIITGFNPIKVTNNYNVDTKDFNQKIFVFIEEPHFTKPLYKRQDGTQITMTPYMARLDNLNYSVDLFVNVRILVENYNETEKINETFENKINDVCIGRLPIMVGSKACILSILPNIEDEQFECRYDLGGYFIINGNEKVLISQDRIKEIYVLIFKPNNVDYLHAEIRSTSDIMYLPPKTLSISVSNKPNYMGRIIRVNASFLKSEVPVVVLFRALGILTDEEIIHHIVYNIKDPFNHYMIEELRACCQDANGIYTKEDAEEALIRNMTGAYKNIQTLEYVLKNDLLPHVTGGMRRKAVYLGHMIKRILRIYLKYDTYDNRDSYINKRIDTPGILMSNLFRQCYSKMIKDMKTAIEKDIKNWRFNHSIADIIHDKNNIIKYFKQSLLDSWLKYALSTGNWGIKAVGSFQNIKQGVSQVLSRMSYVSTLSQLRRINTAMEKNGKLVQPRKLDISQFGVICPAETPEGAPVGLVKNMAISTSISIHMCSIFIRELVVKHGTIIYNDDCREPLEFMRQMGCTDNANVMVNGEIIGYHTNPKELYETFKKYKRTGVIYPMTGVVWDIQKRIVSLSTEGGRMYRPLFIVDDGSRLRVLEYFEKYPIFSNKNATVSFESYLLPRVLGIQEDEGFIEYMDIEEINQAMIAMFPEDLTKPPKGNTKKPLYTHCEIHPALINGVVGVNIPFSNYNQSPRNTYQCLWEEEELLMANGTYKKIKDINIGDEVITFDLDKMITSPTKVVNHMVQETNKNIVKVRVKYTNRTLVCTDDHKFMTLDGWKPPAEFDENTRIGVLCDAIYHKKFIQNVETLDLLKCTELALMTEHINNKNKHQLSFDEWRELIVIKGEFLFMPVEVEQHPNVTIADIEVESTNHSFCTRSGMAVSNSAMAKQTVGMFATNFNHRMDTISNVLNYSQQCLNRTMMAKYTNSMYLPSGINAIVAIMSHTGFNQEDSIILNQDAIDRGLFCSTHYKSMKEQCSKNHSTGEEEIFMKPSKDDRSKPCNYDKIGEDGFVPVNTYVKNNDIIIGKIMPRKNKDKMYNQDCSVAIKPNDDGYVDVNYQDVNNEGYNFCKVRIRNYRKPQIGDKLASSNAQKGCIGMIYRHQDMPFTKDGIVPDIIMNPHAIPSRMTIGQLIECILGKAMCFQGKFGDCTPFHNIDIEKIGDILEECGLERYGNEVLYNGRTGEQIKTQIFIGPTYYQRLKHMAQDKIHCLSADHEVLTDKGWKYIPQVSMEDNVAILKNNIIVYEKPLDIMHYPHYKGKMYKIQNDNIDLEVTANHRMYVRNTHNNATYRLERADKIIGKQLNYKRNAIWDVPDYQFILDGHDEPMNMDAWIMIFGLWKARGSAEIGQALFHLNKDAVCDILCDILTLLKFVYVGADRHIAIQDHHLRNYLINLDYYSLPDWVWCLSQKQCRQLIYAIQIDNMSTFNIYYASSITMANDMQRLCIHAGWGATILKNDMSDIHRVYIDKLNNEPRANDKGLLQKEVIYEYEGPVYCLSVSSEVFMVRRNGKHVWTGNSRGSNGPVVYISRQPSEGRSRSGGLKVGEMERDAIVAHGAATFLKEKMLDVSDNSKQYICKNCGMIAITSPEQGIFKCDYCKTNADIAQVRIPYAFKLFMQELMTMNVQMRLVI
eukprot:762478-Hanusia_phi.AAC.8